MGKSHKKNINWYDSDHCKGFGSFKNRKSYSHHQVRTENRSILQNNKHNNCDYVYSKFDCKNKNRSHYHDFLGKTSNIPNMNHKLDINSELHRQSNIVCYNGSRKYEDIIAPCTKWKPDDGNIYQELNQRIFKMRHILDTVAIKKNTGIECECEICQNWIDINACDYDYFNATFKQLKRRGIIQKFTGYDRSLKETETEDFL